jgi:hypothetical protein
MAENASASAVATAEKLISTHLDVPDSHRFNTFLINNQCKKTIFASVRQSLVPYYKKEEFKSGTTCQQGLSTK